MVHRGVRRECPECGKVLSDLWKHMRTVHGQYRRRVKIPKEKVVGADGKTVVVGSTPTKGSSDIEVSPTSSPDLKSTTATPMPTTPTVNNNNVGKKNVVSGSVDSNKSKNKRKSSPPVKVKMSFNFAKSAKKQRSGKS